MTIRVTVETDLLRRALTRFIARFPDIEDQIVRKIAFDVVADVAERVPVDTGRYRAGWRVSLDTLASEGAESETVSVSADPSGGTRIEVVNPVEYGPFIEYGTSTRPPGNHLASALATVRTSLPVALAASEVAAAWKAAGGGTP